MTTYPLHLLYDGACPVCQLEMHELATRDVHGRLCLVDIAAPGFDPAPWGATLEAMNARIHAVDAAGVTTIGVAALRLAYAAVGLGAWFEPTRWPLLAPLFEAGYGRFARHRYAIGRAAGPLINVMAARRARRRAVSMHARMGACADGACGLDDHGRTSS